ncbi:MAG: penicillin-binding protein 2 [Bifidobacteriaceae bacterium]|jgi:peptidoglycan glycosyltransferase|nr:penicillin-binding protein 2 [Bifidobacteriaceae bacterium]
MNAQIRRMTVLVVLMFLALLAGVTWIQYAKAAELKARPDNTRSYYQSFDHDRGPIIVASGQVIASSTEVDDDYGYQRQYANGPLYAPVTGYFTVLPSSTGIEWAENQVLEGTADSLFWSRIQDLVTGKEPMGGAVELTIDPVAQQAAWDALGDQKGSVVVLDAKTGEILVLVSKPSYDPNLLAAHSRDDILSAYEQMEQDPDNPLYNRAIAGNLYFPGSTFKLITAAAALESGNYTADSELEAPAELDLPNSDHKLTNFGDSSCSSTGTMTMAQALTVSCNTAFGQLGMDLGQDALNAQAEKFGFGQDLAVPLTVTPSQFPQGMSIANTAMAAIGQYEVKVTPLQMAMVASAIVNDGRLMEPHLVRTERDANLSVIATTSANELGRPISAETASTLHDMMVAVAVNGTAQRAAVDGVTVGAKTGTAQKDADHAPDVWTVGFAESGGRSLAIAVVVEDGGSAGAGGTGGTVAAPIVSTVLKAVLNR